MRVIQAPRLFAAAALSAMGFFNATAASSAQELLFWSNQAQPVEEAQAMRDNVLAGFGKPVTYQPQEPGPFVTRIKAEYGKPMTVIATGGLASIFQRQVAVIDHVDPDLTVRGLMLIHARNQAKGKSRPA